MSQVFLSYSRHDDEPFVKQLYEDLTKNGVDVWWDRKTMESRGRTFLQELRDAIEASDHLIAIVGPNAVTSDYVKVEWEHAILFAKGVLPILRMGDYNLVPPKLSKLHCPNFLKERHYDEAFEELLRLLDEPLPKLGPFLTSVPSLPPNYLPRTEYLDRLNELVMADIHRPVVTTSTKQISALRGMGGTGKSVLAAAFARTTEIRRACNDGILWVTIGSENPDPIGGMRLIGTEFGDDTANYSSQKQAEASLTRVLSDKVCLIVLDDVWKVPDVMSFVNALGPRCRLLITTRNEDVVTSLGALECEIEVLSKRSALELMANWCEQEINSLPPETAKVADECGYLPLALSMCGAMAKSGTAWSDILEALQQSDLEFVETQLPNYPDPKLGRAFKVSIDFLSTEDPDAVKRYEEFAIFTEDESVPEAAPATLWAYTGNVKKRNSGKLLTKLKDRALLRLDGEAPNRQISLHDLQLDYLRATAADLPNLHNKLLEAYRKECGNKWSAGPEDGYFFEHLAYHMKEAGKQEELRKLLLDFGWMCAKLDKVYIIQKETGVKKPNVNSLLHDYDYLLNDKEIRLVQGAIRLSFNAIAEDKTQLAGQLLGRLLCFNEYGIQLLLGQVRECKDGIRLLPITSSLKPPGGPLVKTLEGHEDSVTTVAITPDGKCAVTGSGDRTLKIWDLEKGEEKATLKGHEDSVTAVAITPDGKCAISASDDRTLKIWGLEKGEEKATLKGHNGIVTAVAVTPDGKYAVSASNDRTLKIWNLEKGEEKATLKGHNGIVTAVAINPDGKSAVSASYDRTLKIWDLEKGEEMATLKGHEEKVTAVAVNPDGKSAVSVSWDYTLKIWDLEKGEEKTTLKGHENEGVINAVAFTPNGKSAVSASYRTLKIWDLEKGEEKATLKGHDRGVTNVVITPDGKSAVSASHDKTLKIWDLEKGEEKTTLKGHENEGVINAVAFTPNGKYAVSASDDRTLKIWDLEKGEEMATLKGHEEKVTAVAVTPDGKYAVSASDDRTLKIWDLEKGEEKATLKGHEDIVTAVAVTPDGKSAVSASFDRTLKVWDLKKEEEKATLKGHTRKVYVVSITPDGKSAVSASNDRTLKIWDLEKGEEKTTLEGHEDIITAVSITPDGKSAVSASFDRTLKVWDLEKGEEKATLKGHEDIVTAVAVTPDGKYAVSASFDRTLKVWDLKKEEEKATLKGHDDVIFAVAITPDGKFAVSASWDRSLKTWDLKHMEKVSNFTGESSFKTIAVSPDGQHIFSGDALGKMHFLRLDRSN